MHFIKALSLDKMEEFEDAMKTIEKAIHLVPKNADIWYHKGRILEKLQRYEEALKAYQVDLRIDDKDVKSWTSKANTLVKLERYKEALEAFDEILKLDPDNTDVKQNKNSTIKELKNQEFSSLINEIESKIQNKDYSNVIELCDKAMELELNSPILYIYKGNSLYKLKQHEGALKCYDAALEINPQNYEALDKKRKIIQEQTNKIEGETLQDHSDNVNSVTITSDNKKIVSGSNDNTIRIWDIDTGEVLKTLSNGIVWKIFDRGKMLKTPIGQSHNVNSIAITPDNKKIVSGSGDRTIKVWQILI